MKFLLFIVLFTYCNTVMGRIVYDHDIKPADIKLKEYLPYLIHQRVGLIINQTSKIGSQSLLDILIANKVNVVKIFVPEHGFRGNEDAGARVESSIDSATGIPVISLYGSHKKPKPEEVADIDILVYDLQDVGVRFYTYISTLQYCMEACAENNKQFLVLDRPNPNGFYVAGPVLDTQNKSFVGMQAIPIVYGMTIGEYANMLKGENWFNNANNLHLIVIPCDAYTHDKKYQLPIAPSPNLQTMAAIYAYPTLCLFEGTQISVGRGTTLPFGQFGSPQLIDHYQYSFTPISTTGAKKPLYENKTCYGVKIDSNEDALLKTLNKNIYLDWIINAYNNYPSPEKDKFFNQFFIKLVGTDTLIAQIKNGVSSNEIQASWQTKIDIFLKIRQKYLLYK